MGFGAMVPLLIETGQLQPILGRGDTDRLFGVPISLPSVLWFGSMRAVGLVLGTGAGGTTLVPPWC